MESANEKEGLSMSYALLIHTLLTAATAIAAIYTGVAMTLFHRALRSTMRTLRAMEDLDVRLSNLERGQDITADRIASLNGKYGAVMAKLKQPVAQSMPDPDPDDSERTQEREKLTQMLARKAHG